MWHAARAAFPTSPPTLKVYIDNYELFFLGGKVLGPASAQKQASMRMHMLLGTLAVGPLATWASLFAFNVTLNHDELDCPERAALLGWRRGWLQVPRHRAASRRALAHSKPRY